MIYTVTFNPALDVSGDVEDLVPNEKSYVQKEIHTPGGNGINSGIIAHRLQSKVVLTGFIGGPNGEEIKRLIDGYKVPRSFVSIKGSTRMNLTINNKDNHLQTRLSFPGPHIRPLEKKGLLQFLDNVKEEDLVVLGGSLPPGLDAKFVEQIIKRVHRKKAKCLVDCPGPVLKKVIDARPDFIKPNLTEFHELTNTKGKTIKAVMPVIQKFLEKVPVICLSSIEGGALLATRTETWWGKIPRVKIHSTVGAGDSMVGAMSSVYSKDKDTPIEELLRWGLAASCATLTERGLTLGSKKCIMFYRPKIELRKIS